MYKVLRTFISDGSTDLLAKFPSREEAIEYARTARIARRVLTAPGETVDCLINVKREGA